MDQRIGDFATTVIEATNSDAVWDASCGFFEAFGFDGVVHCARDNRCDTGSRDTRLSNSITDWRDAYFREGDDQRDPLFAYTALMPTAFLTGSEFMADHTYLKHEDIAVIRRAEDFGLISGLALKMPSPTAATTSGWNLVSGFRRNEMIQIYQENVALLAICATLADREMQQKPKAGTQLHLTPREVECLTWLAAGLRTEQISDRLGIRPVTVDLHVRNARKRLGARTREQALAIAIHAGLIQP